MALIKPKGTSGFVFIMPPEIFEFASPGKSVSEIYPEESEDDDILDEHPRKRTRQHASVAWVLTGSNISTYSECTAKIGELCPSGFSKADSPYTSIKTGDTTYKFKCGLCKSHSCPVFFKVVRYARNDMPTEQFDLFSRGEHTHVDFVGKVFSPEVKKIIAEGLNARQAPKAIFTTLTQTLTTSQKPSFKAVRSYINNNRQKILELADVKTYGDYMTVCQQNNLFLVPHCDNYTSGVIAVFDGKLLMPNNTFVEAEALKEECENSLPPLPFQAVDTLADMERWRNGGWKKELSEYSDTLTSQFSTLLASPNVPFFTQCLLNLLTANGWSTKTNKFYSGKLNLRGLHRNYKHLVQDYNLHQKRKRWCVLYTTWGKLKTLYDSDHRARDDTYKTNRNGFPLETGGTCGLNKRYCFCYLAVKSHEDSVASEIVDFLLVRTMHLGFGGLWEPPFHSLDHSFAFFNANAAFPKTVGKVVEHLELSNPTRKLTSPDDITQAACWSHCSMKLNEKASHFNDANNVEPFKKGVRRIHRITLKAVREHAFAMLIETFEEGEGYICEWFQEVWWGKWSGWTLGTLPPGKPSTQNGAEGKNDTIKDEVTLRKLLELSAFNQAMLSFLRDETHFDDEHPLPTCGVVRQDIWREALLRIDKSHLQLMTRTNALAHLYGEEESVFIVPTPATYSSLESTSVTDRRKEIAPLVALFIALVSDPTNPPAIVTTFDEYLDLYESFTIVQLLPNPHGEFHFHSCNCAEYGESATCACTVSVGLFKGAFTAPLEKRLDLIGRLPTIGRPPKAKGALTRQPMGKLSAKIKRQAAKRVREGEVADADCEAQASQPIANSHKCFLCDRATYAAKMLLCDGCNRGYHTFCMVPKIVAIPEGRWMCMPCLVNEIPSK